MQSNILLKLKKTLKILKEEKFNELKEFLEYHEDGYLTSNEVANRLDISFEDAQIIMRELYTNDYLDMNFKVCCENAIDIAEEEIYESIEDIPQEICDKCEKKCVLLKKIIVIYKVIRIIDEDV
ncbi:hypothetical protein IZT14_001668 [Clostridium perfringens]|nr:hypothetical protein [Clostridium perfringens]HBI6919550.1 hypothetical protein [Clostridium perfringens]HBI7037980.1 hypothetical protein [Clostridium perfringens]